MPASNRADFQALADEPIADAATLVAAQRWSAAYYLAGYAIECGPKACVARLTKEYDFPRRNTADIYTHNLDKLVNSAGLGIPFQAAMEVERQLELSWTFVKDWSEDARYDVRSEAQARDMYDKTVIVLNWIRTQW